MENFDFVNGELLLLDKELEWTSFDVVNKIRYALKPQKIKIGHAGTLDPLATGLLIICTGKMTKKIGEFQAQKKTYSGKMQLGITTPSLDLETAIDKYHAWNHIDETMIMKSTKQFIGEIQQIPPIYSALKLKGEKLYEKARRGENVELQPRNVIIYDFEITSIHLPNIEFIVECSKGTYIRSLVDDFGKILNSGACLTALRRLKIGEYDVKNAVSINELIEKIKKLKLINESI